MPPTERQGKDFVPLTKPFWIARALDAVAPFWLKDPLIASCVVNALRKGESDLNYNKLLAYVVMPNHVHALLTPKSRSKQTHESD